MKLRIHSALGAALSAALLAGCGGGGGDAGIPATNTYAVATAFKNVLALNGSFTLSGTGSDGRAYTALLQFQPRASATFPVTGATAAVNRQTLTLTAGGTSSSSYTDNYYDASASRPLGTVDDSNACSLVTAYTVPSASASVGSTGTLSTESDLASCSTSATVITTTTTTWSLESGPNGAFALACEKASVPATSTDPSGTISICIEVNADGSLGTRMRLGVTISNVPLFSLTATNY